MMVSYVPSYPMTYLPEDVWEAMTFNHEKEFFMDVQCRGEYPKYRLLEYERKGIKLEQEPEDAEILKKGTVDYIGFSYYMSTVSTIDKNVQMTGGNQVMACKNPYLKESEWGWAIDKIEEDGSIIDDYRIDYFRQHIKAMKDAVLLDGVDLIGYTPWGCIDVVSSGTGEMKKKIWIYLCGHG